MVFLTLKTVILQFEFFLSIMKSFHIILEQYNALGFTFYTIHMFFWIANLFFLCSDFSYGSGCGKDGGRTARFLAAKRHFGVYEAANYADVDAKEIDEGILVITGYKHS